MKKNIFAITAAAALVLNIAATSVTTFAADGDTDQTPVTAGGDTSNATASLTTKDADGNESKITLDETPTINFGSQQISAEGNKFEKAESITDALKVTNPGLDQQWSVSLSNSNFKNAKGEILKGATFTLKAGSPSLNNKNSKVASVVDYSNTTDGTATAKVLSAADGTQGVGINTDTYDVATASLDIPAGNVAGDYTSTLTWTLDNAPK